MEISGKMRNLENDCRETGLRRIAFLICCYTFPQYQIHDYVTVVAFS